MGRLFTEVTMTYLLQCDESTGGCGTRFPGDLNKCPKCGCESWLCVDASLYINPLDYTYDIETYPDIFTCVFTHVSSGTKWYFEISPRINQINEFITFVYRLRDIGARGVGFNNVGFDYPVIHFICTNPFVSWVEIYNKAMSIISSGDRWGNTVWESDHIFPQLDLYKLHHYDNPAKSTSLKALEFAMRMHNIEDLPFKVGTLLTDPQKDVLHRYNAHDVHATTLFYVRSLEHIGLRETLTREYGVNMLSYSNTKIGATILTHELEKAGIRCYENFGGRKSPRQTVRASINLGEVIFPYVKFEHPRFKHIWEFFRNKVITETKGAMHDIDVTDWPKEYVCLDKSLWPTSFSVSEKKGRLIASNLHVMVDGCLYIYGTGGLHMSIVSTDTYSDDDYQIIDVDVASFYPNLAIKNKMYPAHLGVEFCDIYLSIYERRNTFKKGTPLNAALKEALNASYGNSNNAFSPLYDPFYTMQTTINGQLLLCMLVEQLIKVPGLTMIQCNTDGVTYRCPRHYIDHTRNLCRWWEQLTGLVLEESLYSRMAINNVNNYIAVYENGKIKKKGSFATEKEYHQDPSALIVPKAAEAALIRGEDIETFIRGHKDPFDFCMRAKVPRADQLMMCWPDIGVEIEMPSIIRYFISTNGGSLVKVSPAKGKPGTWKRKAGVSDAEYNRVMAELNKGLRGGDAIAINDAFTDIDGTPHDERIHTKNKSKYDEVRTSIGAGRLATDCSNMDDFDWSSVNYDYYIEQARKLVEPLMRK
ncbi:putative DNA polymerase [Vibrio phage vB_VchM-138]|uniref:DNA polymerase n=1 Tax=Vibrio phage vB_VchM-138 TaxID=1127518 RepID=UPI0002536DF1|nr:DNA polymerase [Vibrio phage vB_VchM-138]AFC22681.1 putative DNA polymerase [Vibrio phage vB_VchM-138]